MNIVVNDAKDREMHAVRESSPLVSIVVATHNRPQSLRRLLLSMMEQEYQNFEVIVADDASSPANVAECKAFWPQLDSRFFYRHVPTDLSRKSPSTTRNYGVGQSRGAILAFCDDDDVWIRADHLTVSVAVLEQTGADLFIGNMRTSMEGRVLDGNYHEQGLQSLRRTGSNACGRDDLYFLDQNGFRTFVNGRIPHFDAVVVKKTLWNRVGGFWEKVAFAEDYEMIFRLMENAERIVVRTEPVAQLDVSWHPSVFRAHAPEDQILFGILATLKSSLSVSNPSLRRRLRYDRAGRLLALAMMEAERGRLPSARELAWEALLARPSFSGIRTLWRIRARAHWRTAVRDFTPRNDENETVGEQAKPNASPGTCPFDG
jgi:hypothetical protein